MSNEPLRCERSGPIAILTLARPERRNALSLEMIRALRGALAELGDARVVILAAEGAVFCSGHDLTVMKDRDEAGYSEIFRECTLLMQSLQTIPQPVIAEVGGLATAAGCQLAASCDLVVCSDSAGFATPGVKIGLFCSTPMVALIRCVGRKRAMEMLLTGRVVGAWEAAEWGLVNRVVEHASLRPACLELAGQIASASAATVALGKRVFYSQVDLAQDPAYAIATAAMTENAMAPDAREGISAFLEKRTAVWRRT